MEKQEASKCIHDAIHRAGNDHDPGQGIAVSMTNQHCALSCNLENDLDSAVNRKSDLFYDPNLCQRHNNYTVTEWETMTGYLPSPTGVLSFFHLSERRKDSCGIFQWVIWMRSSCGIVVEFTMALWAAPLTFILCYLSLQLVEWILPTILQWTSMILYHDWRNHGFSTSPMTATIPIPRLEGFVIVALAMIILGGIGSMCSWMETEFLNATADQPIWQVWNLTVGVPPDMARSWMQYEKRFLHMIVCRIGFGE